MNHTLDAQGLVELPKLDAGGAMTLVEALLTRFKQEEELPRAVADAAKRMKQAMIALGEAMRARFDAGNQEDRSEAHRSAASRWKAVHDLLEAWAALSEEGEKSNLARRLLSALFAEGLAFTRPPFRSAWSEAEQRLTWLSEQDLDGAFVELGGAEFLEGLRAAHKRYGEVLGVKKANELRELPSLREPFDELLSRVRKYAVQVIALGELEVSGSREQSLRLLAPLMELQSVRTRSSPSPAQDTTEAAPPAPSAPPAPAPAATPAVPPSTAPATP
jgi:hypothetical protein